FELVTVGAGDQLQAEWAESHPWTRESEKGFLASFDIGIMPLPDDPWTRGKCGYKLLQYFSAGVPAIASPVGANLEILGPDRGRFASSEAEWLEALEALILDSATRREMGANARSFVEENYSYQRWAPRLAEMLRSI
ncbi:MAG: glycosyltransferase family 4 protein, partial [Solirubrobacterales bacterium]|nr:glycosyltransferase family 4 protein [Solirubrobacterales bacterium]